jgi:DNA polymerase phi
MFGLATSEASTSTATDPEPIDMLLDTLIALLDKGSSDLKNLASMVVGLVAPAFTRSSIEHLVAVSSPPSLYLS